MTEPFTSGVPALPEGAADHIDAIFARIRQAQAIQLIGHLRPDGDCFGSLVTMHGILQALEIEHRVAAARHPMHNPYLALEGFDCVEQTLDASFQPDLLLYLDTATQERGFEELPWQAPAINIDHHGSNTRYGALNWIEPKCAAVGEMLFHFIRHTAVPCTPWMADAMLVALSTDTGSFRFGNTGPEQLRVAAALLECGAKMDRISNVAYDSRHPEGVRITARVMEHLALECDGKLAWSQLRQSELETLGGEGAMPENLANELRSLAGVEMAILFTETTEGAMRLNLRSEGGVDVSAFAGRFGGGGHPCAAGATIPADNFDAERDRVLNEARALFNQ